VIPAVVQTERRPRIEDFAASAVENHSRNASPQGPYFLAGWSVWGFWSRSEVAQQLMHASAEVRSLAMVDTFLAAGFAQADQSGTNSPRGVGWKRNA